MAGVIGSVQAFNEADDSWIAYTERLEHFFMANDITSEEKKKAILLNSVGATTYKLVSNLVSPRKPGDVPYREIIEVVKAHPNPRPSTIVQRFKFNSCVRQPGESIRSYVAELKRLTEFCDYENNLEEMLRDRLVCGINDKKIQQRLLAESKLTFAKAMEIAQAMETAAGNVVDLTRQDQVCVVKDHSKTPARVNHFTPRKCYRCGGPHAHTSCKFKDSKCFKCQKIGHLAKVCRSSDPHKSRPKENVRSRHKAHVLVEEPKDNGEESFLFSIFSNSKPVYRDLKINGVNIKFQVDTGASISVINKDDFLDMIKVPLHTLRKI
ncbi:polyprotein [Plakobranchus ocellatus]|uniref:Polyprotein n=1 Tax=Plakobranchus ocellatus TaxID=259542 RepID=A0AAV4CC91_9GAST|nr:polyprotein [Plakobranchus ocellatus]